LAPQALLNAENGRRSILSSFPPVLCAERRESSGRNFDCNSKRKSGRLARANERMVEYRGLRKDANLPLQSLGSEKIFKGAVFDIERDRLRDANGTEIIREVIRHPGGAGALPLFDDGRVALVKQYRHPARRELLEIPAGRIEDGETPEMCAAREVEQEIGFRAGRIEKLMEFYSTPGFCEEKLHVYLATALIPTSQALDHDELIEVVYLPFTEAVKMAECGEIEDSKTIIGLLLAARRFLPI
jgi:ADP-ribose pyrophosphatase